MKTHFAALATLTIALLGCGQAEHQADGSSGQVPATQLLATITFQVDRPEGKQDSPSPYISLADPENDLRLLRNAGQVVYAGTELTLVLDYPLRGEFSFPVNASSPNGFTRAELARKVAALYRKVYEEEEKTSKIAVIPPEQRQGVANRNETNGKYGIWGHDLGDLDLHTIEISRGADGTVLAHLGIDS